MLAKLISPTDMPYVCYCYVVPHNPNVQLSSQSFDFFKINSPYSGNQTLRLIFTCDIPSIVEVIKSKDIKNVFWASNLDNWQRLFYMQKVNNGESDFYQGEIILHLFQHLQSIQIKYKFIIETCDGKFHWIHDPKSEHTFGKNNNSVCFLSLLEPCPNAKVFSQSVFVAVCYFQNKFGSDLNFQNTPKQAFILNQAKLVSPNEYYPPNLIMEIPKDELDKTIIPSNACGFGFEFE